MSQLARRYAQAAWEVALKGGDTAPLVADFTAFFTALQGAPRLHQALTNPAFKDERGKVLREVLEASQVSVVAARLLQLLIEHERVPLLHAVAQELGGLADEAAGRLRAKVWLAVPATPEQIKRIEEVLSHRMGRPVVAQVKVQPDLVAGMVCRIGKLTFDSSLKNQLGQFAERAGAAEATH